MIIFSMSFPIFHIFQTIFDLVLLKQHFLHLPSPVFLLTISFKYDPRIIFSIPIRLIRKINHQNYFRTLLHFPIEA